MITIENKSANGLYLQALEVMLGARTEVAPRGMPVREYRGAVLILDDATDCVITLPERRLSYFFMVAEFIWIATGRDDVASIAPYNRKIVDFSDDGETFFGAYGLPWRRQAKYIIEKLWADSASRQAVLTYWRPSPGTTKDVPCTISTQYLVREGKLHTITTMRSSDVWLGLPYDIFNQARLAACIAGAVGVPQGSLQMQLGSLHLYERDLKKARTVVDKANVPLTRVWLPELPRLPPLEYGDLMAAGFPIPQSFPMPWRDYIEVMNRRFAPDSELLACNPFKAVVS
jgi:thymidylate synthase